MKTRLRWEWVFLFVLAALSAVLWARGPLNMAPGPMQTTVRIIASTLSALASLYSLLHTIEFYKGGQMK